MEKKAGSANWSSDSPAATFANLLDALVDEQRPSIREPLAIVVAHPDDEVIGIGAQLPRLANVTFIHVTDGSPRDLGDARRAGFATANDYAAARRAEFRAALRLAEIPESRAIELKVRDQEAIVHVNEIVRKLRDLFTHLKPRVVVTQPYEGGHPDHDATAFAVHTACAASSCPPIIVEMTSYHQGESGMATGRFLPSPEREIREVTLTPAEVRFKTRLFECYKTQQYLLRLFSIHTEFFRIAPRYDFLSAPHPGPLFYESLGFGITGERFRSLLQAAISLSTP